MKSNEQNHLAELIEEQINGTISGERFAELEQTLIDSAEARALYLDLTHQHAALDQLSEALEQEHFPETQVRARPFLPAALGIAATLLFGLFLWSKSQAPPTVATIVSSDHASWESSLPTNPNAQLTPGFLKLITGVATIRFLSGVEVILEAPAHLVLETPMKGKLLAGSAVIDVPEEAIGFIMETPGSYAVDHGTAFSVSVDEGKNKSSFEVLSGEISVHHPGSGEVIFLTDAQRVSADSAGLSDSAPQLLEEGSLPEISRALRLTTGGREATVIRGDDLDAYLHPDFLMAKRGTFVEKFDRRSLFAFTLPPAAISEARLRLNLVPCGLGFASRLPEVSGFALYGLEGNSGLGTSQLNWQSAPGPEEGTRLLDFTISRGQREGNIKLTSDLLTVFLREHAGRDVTFLLVRESDEAQGNGLVHAFASSRHPSAAGPILELSSDR